MSNYCQQSKAHPCPFCGKMDETTIWIDAENPYDEFMTVHCKDLSRDVTVELPIKSDVPDILHTVLINNNHKIFGSCQTNRRARST